MKNIDSSKLVQATTLLGALCLSMGLGVLWGANIKDTGSLPTLSLTVAAATAIGALICTRRMEMHTGVRKSIIALAGLTLFGALGMVIGYQATFAEADYYRSPGALSDHYNAIIFQFGIGALIGAILFVPSAVELVKKDAGSTPAAY